MTAHCGDPRPVTPAIQPAGNAPIFSRSKPTVSTMAAVAEKTVIATTMSPFMLLSLRQGRSGRRRRHCRSGRDVKQRHGGFLSCVLHPELAADGLHSRVAAVHVFRVEARVAQLDGGLAADMEAVGAVDDHRLGLVELADPLQELLGIPPLNTLGDILPARDGRPRP